MSNPQKVQIKFECWKCEEESVYHIEIKKNASEATGGGHALVKKCTTCGTDNRLELPANIEVLSDTDVLRGLD